MSGKSEGCDGEKTYLSQRPGKGFGCDSLLALRPLGNIVDAVCHKHL